MVCLLVQSRGRQHPDQDLAYVLFLDGEGNLLAHTLREGFTMDLLPANRASMGEREQVETLQTEGGAIQDLVVPVPGGNVGMVRLGMSMERIETAVARQVQNILLWAAIILVLALSVAYRLSSFLTKPISRLAEVARAVGKSDFRWEAPAWAKDEIGILGSNRRFWPPRFGFLAISPKNVIRRGACLPNQWY